MKKNNTVISVKMSKEEAEEITNTARMHHETRSGYARRLLIESARNPLYSNKDVILILMELAGDMQRMTEDNCFEIIKEINSKGERICQILSSR